MDICCKNQEKILRLQFQKILNNKKVIREISYLLENVVCFFLINWRRYQQVKKIYCHICF